MTDAKKPDEPPRETQAATTTAVPFGSSVITCNLCGQAWGDGDTVHECSTFRVSP